MTDFELRPAPPKTYPWSTAPPPSACDPAPYTPTSHRNQYREVMNGLVQRMLATPWQLMIAHPTDYPEEIAGFCLHRQTDHGKPVIGMAYVKSAYRRRGLGRQLLNHSTDKRPDFLAVLGQPKVLGWCWDRGLRPQLSPYLL